MSIDVTLASLIDSLLAGERVAVDRWPVDVGALEDWGFTQGPHGISLPPSIEALHGGSIREHMNQRAANWTRSLEIHSAISSTSDRLLVLADRESIDGVVCLAELQTRGRGRRGRSWLTPVGGNLALSAGFAIQRPLSDLGGLSLVVGLALLDALETLGFESLALKWPNDLLLAGAKLGGILIELKTPAVDQAATEAIVGVGINLRLSAQARAAIDQQVTDLSAAGAEVARNKLAADVIGNLVDYIGEFERVGFAPMREQYERYHWLHGKQCEVRIGVQAVSGRVVGVTELGELQLQTPAGLQIFRGGEVSLRARPAETDG